MAEHIVSVGHVRPADVSAGHVLELIQRLAVDRLSLLQLDVEQRASGVLRRSAWIGIGIACLLAAWLGLLVAAVLGLAERVPLPTSLLLVSASQLLLGAGLIAWGRRPRLQA